MYHAGRFHVPAAQIPLQEHSRVLHLTPVVQLDMPPVAFRLPEAIQHGAKNGVVPGRHVEGRSRLWVYTLRLIDMRLCQTGRDCAKERLRPCSAPQRLA